MEPIQANVRVKEEDDKDVIDKATLSRGKANTAVNEAFDKLTALAMEMFKNMKLAVKGEAVPPLKSLIVNPVAPNVTSGSASSGTATSATIKTEPTEQSVRVMEGNADENEDDDISVKSEDDDEQCPCIDVSSDEEDDEDEDGAEEENNLPDV